MCFAQKPDSANTQETCTTYNVLKLARSLFRWTGESKYADFYERALLNGILGTQRTPRPPTQLAQGSPPPHEAASQHRPERLLEEDDRCASQSCDSCVIGSAQAGLPAGRISACGRELIYYEGANKF